MSIHTEFILQKWLIEHPVLFSFMDLAVIRSGHGWRPMASFGPVIFLEATLKAPEFCRLAMRRS